MANITVTLTEHAPDWIATITALESSPAATGQGATPELALEAARAAAFEQTLLAAQSEGQSIGPAEIVAIESHLRNQMTKTLAEHQWQGRPALPIPPPWGADVSTFPDLDPTLSLIASKRVIAETVSRRLITPTGSLFYDQDSGIDVRELLSAGLTPAQVHALRAHISSEAEADERVLSAQADFSFDTQRSAMTIRIAITPMDGGDGFDLVMRVSQFATTISVTELLMPVSLRYLLSPPTADEMRQTLLHVLAAARFPVSSWQSYSAGRTLIEAESMALSDLAALIAQIARGGFLEHAERSWLDLLARNVYDLERKPGLATRGLLRLSDIGGVGPMTLEAGSVRVVCGDLYYTNIDTISIPLGKQAEGVFQAERLDTSYNVPDGSPFELVTSLPGVTVSTGGPMGDTWITRQGIDAEADTELRVRCRTRWATRGGGASALAYQHWAMSASLEVAKVAVFPHKPLPGQVTVVLAGAGGPVSPDAVEAVRLALSDDRIPVCVKVVVKSASPAPVVIAGEVKVRAARAATAQAAIRKALVRLVAGLPLGGTLYSGDIVRTIMDADPGTVDVTLSTGDTDMELQQDHVGVLNVDISDKPNTGSLLVSAV